MHASSHLGTGVKLECKSVHLFTQQTNLRRIKYFFLYQDSQFRSRQRSLLAVFTFKTVLYLIYADAPDPESLTRVRLLLCRAKKVVQLPDYHFVNHRIEIKSHDKDYSKVNLYEHAEAHSGLPRQGK